jgi:hypothetical protein
LRCWQRCCWTLESASSVIAKDFANVIMSVGWLRMGDAHISPALTTAFSAKAKGGFTSDRLFLMPRNVWSSLGARCVFCRQKHGPNRPCVCHMCRGLSRACSNRSDYLLIFSLPFCFQFSSLLCLGCGSFCTNVTNSVVAMKVWLSYRVVW